MVLKKFKEYLFGQKPAMELFYEDVKKELANIGGGGSSQGQLNQLVVSISTGDSTGLSGVQVPHGNIPNGGSVTSLITSILPFGNGQDQFVKEVFVEDYEENPGYGKIRVTLKEPATAQNQFRVFYQTIYGE